jgi:hypothetical protein
MRWCCIIMPVMDAEWNIGFSTPPLRSSVAFQKKTDERQLNFGSPTYLLELRLEISCVGTVFDSISHTISETRFNEQRELSHSPCCSRLPASCKNFCFLFSTPPYSMPTNGIPLIFLDLKRSVMANRKNTPSTAAVTSNGRGCPIIEVHGVAIPPPRNLLLISM